MLSDDTNLESRRIDGEAALGADFEQDSAVRRTVSGLAYDSMRRIAKSYLVRERVDHTLEPTALVHEAYVRLAQQDGVDPKHRSLFLAYSAREMRRVLIDHARGKGRAKRGGGWNRLPLSSCGLGESSPEIELLDLENALETLREHDERQAQIVELRFFSGMNLSEVAEVLAVSLPTVEREWRLARARLFRLLEGRHHGDT